MCQVICWVITAVVQWRSRDGGSPITATLRTPPTRGCSWASTSGATTKVRKQASMTIPTPTSDRLMANSLSRCRGREDQSPTAPSARGRRQPGVPEVQARRRAELAAQFPPRDIEGVVVAEFHLAHVLVMDGLNPFHERLALLEVALLPELGHQ